MLTNSPRAFGAVAILLHWLIALLFLSQLVLGLLMGRAFGPATMFSLIQWHKSFGLLVLGLALLRICWSLAGTAPLPPAGLSPAELRAARIVQGLLMAATIAVPLAGWALVSTSPLMIPTFAFNLVVIPDLPLGRSDAAEAGWTSAHALLAYASGFLVLGHAAAALFHHVARRDDVLLRMLGRPAGDVHTRS